MTMPVPKSVTRINKDGVKYVSNVDRVKYTAQELQRAALRDSAKIIRKRMIDRLKLLPGMRRSRRKYRSAQYWVRRWETDLIIGFKHDTWYGVLQELGDKNQPRRDILRTSTMESINDIRIAQGKYLSAIEDENKALGLIDKDGNEIVSKEDELDD